MPLWSGKLGSRMGIAKVEAVDSNYDRVITTDRGTRVVLDVEGKVIGGRGEFVLGRK